MDSQASSAFWFYDITPEIWSEIDVFEIGARPQPANYYMNTHLFHTLVETVHWHKSHIWKAPYNLAKEFHVYGLEWDPEMLRFTVDGVVVREEPNTHWHQPLALCFDSETFPGWFPSCAAPSGIGWRLVGEEVGDADLNTTMSGGGSASWGARCVSPYKHCDHPTRRQVSHVSPRPRFVARVSRSHYRSGDRTRECPASE
jgi:hypothetical protein